MQRNAASGLFTGPSSLIHCPMTFQLSAISSLGGQQSSRNRLPDFLSFSLAFNRANTASSVPKDRLVFQL
jgi:hypothetical protein